MPDALIDTIRARLEKEPRINLHAYPIRLAAAGGTLTMEGEVADISAKKLALELAAATPGIEGIIDRVRVAPAERMADGAVRDTVRNALMQEPAFAEIELVVIVKGSEEPVRRPPGARGCVRIEVEDGVVTLSGEVPGLGHKRLAGVLAWWVPGSRDVINGLEVVPPEPDNDAEITDAVRLVLEKNPFVNAGQIQIGTHNAVVTLRGMVPTVGERDMAEHDAWYVFGVDRVVNEIVVGS